MNFLSRGAESIIYEEGCKIHKVRKHKSYRIAELDALITKSRVKRESKILRKLNKLSIPTPVFIETRGNTIIMEKLNGVTLKSYTNSLEDQSNVYYELGCVVAHIHNAGVIHGDLTTSNFIYVVNKVYVIDFGLSFCSTKVEDKAVDLYVFERAVGCAHDTALLEAFYQGYRSEGDNAVLERLDGVRLRGRKREEQMIG